MTAILSLGGGPSNQVQFGLTIPPCNPAQLMRAELAIRSGVVHHAVWEETAEQSDEDCVWLLFLAPLARAAKTSTTRRRAGFLAADRLRLCKWSPAADHGVAGRFANAAVAP